MKVVRLAGRVAGLVGILTLFAATADAAEWFVASGSSGAGTAAAPFGRIQDAIAVAQPGDIVTVRSGTYAGALRTVRHGSASLPIRVRSLAGRGSVIVTA